MSEHVYPRQETNSRENSDDPELRRPHSAKVEKKWRTIYALSNYHDPNSRPLLQRSASTIIANQRVTQFTNTSGLVSLSTPKTSRFRLYHPLPLIWSLWAGLYGEDGSFQTE